MNKLRLSNFVLYIISSFKNLYISTAFTLDFKLIGKNFVRAGEFVETFRRVLLSEIRIVFGDFSKRYDQFYIMVFGYEFKKIKAFLHFFNQFFFQLIFSSFTTIWEMVGFGLLLIEQENKDWSLKIL